VPLHLGKAGRADGDLKCQSRVLEFPWGGVVDLHPPEGRFDQRFLLFAFHPRCDLQAFREREVRGAVEERRRNLLIGRRRRIEQADEGIRCSGAGRSRWIIPLSRLRAGGNC